MRRFEAGLRARAGEAAADGVGLRVPPASAERPPDVPAHRPARAGDHPLRLRRTERVSTPPPSAALRRLVNGFQVSQAHPCRRHAGHRRPPVRGPAHERRARRRDGDRPRRPVPAPARARERGRAPRGGRPALRADADRRLPALRRRRAGRRLGRVHRPALLLAGVGRSAALDPHRGGRVRRTCTASTRGATGAHPEEAAIFDRAMTDLARRASTLDARRLRLRAARHDRGRRRRPRGAAGEPPAGASGARGRAVRPAPRRRGGGRGTRRGRGRGPLPDGRRQLLRRRAGRRRCVRAARRAARLGRPAGRRDPRDVPPRDGRRRRAARDRARHRPAQRAARPEVLRPQHAGRSGRPRALDRRVRRAVRHGRVPPGRERRRPASACTSSWACRCPTPRGSAHTAARRRSASASATRRLPRPVRR